VGLFFGFCRCKHSHGDQFRLLVVGSENVQSLGEKDAVFIQGVVRGKEIERIFLKDF